MRLGWRNPRPNDFNSPDERPLKDLFSNLQHFMTWPHVGLRFSGSFSLDTNVTAVPFEPKSASASPFVPGDPYNLWDTTNDQVRVPHDFDTWLAVGSAAFLTSGGAADAIRTFAWRINAVDGVFMTHMTRPSAGGVRASVPLMAPVRAGDTVEAAAAVNTGASETVVSAEAWLLFLPLA